MDDEVLQDTPHRRIVRVNDTVRRPMHLWSATIHELLEHLAAAGFPHSPRFLGIDENGREVLSYIAGDSGPAGWARVVDEAGLVAMANLLREYHEAVPDFQPSGDARWAAFTGAPRPGELVCHGDFAPWNLVWHGTHPVGILDWDYAWPHRKVHDIAYALEYVAPFRDDNECLQWLRYPSPPNRRRRLELFAEAYGLTSTDGLIDEVIDQQQRVLTRTTQLAADGHQPQLTWQTDGTLTDHARRIHWSQTNRHLFE